MKTMPGVEAPAAFLSSSRYCSLSSSCCDLLDIELDFNARDKAKLAVDLFEWVRDSITYELGLSNDTASQTLAKRRGSCTNKSNLLVAMARAAGIPAAFNIMRVRTRLYFGPVCTPRFAKFMSQESLHILSVLHVDGEWLRCDATDDKNLCLNSSHLCRQSKLVEFDGNHDAMIDLDTEHVVFHDETLHPFVDDILSKKARLPSAIVEVMNLYLDFIRRYGREYRKIEMLERDFFQWIRASFPMQHSAFLNLEAHL